MQFSTVATVAAVAAVANAQYNSTVTATSVENKTTLVTITDCENHVCKETVSPAIVSTATVTENNIVTKYTTWCPITAANETVVHTQAPATKNATTSTKHSVSSYEGAGAKALPAVGALVAGAAAFLL
ncbi:covalently-linked cell wall protein 12 [Monosporozyma servazzii]